MVDNDLHRALGRIEGKLDGIAADTARSHVERQTMRDDIDDLKKQSNRYAGGFAVAVLLLTFKDFIGKALGFTS